MLPPTEANIYLLFRTSYLFEYRRFLGRCGMGHREIWIAESRRRQAHPYWAHGTAKYAVRKRFRRYRSRSRHRPLPPSLAHQRLCDPSRTTTDAPIPGQGSQCNRSSRPPFRLKFCRRCSHGRALRAFIARSSRTCRWRGHNIRRRRSSSRQCHGSVPRPPITQDML